jgi:choice-of-anchor B domain-containing protein
MKKLILFIAVIFALKISAQTYPSQNISLLSLIHPNSGTVGIGPDDRRYSGVWGWKQSSTNKEYAIAGSSSGTYFIDVTNPSTPSVSAFVPGRPSCTWREIKTYQNYCYVVSDDPAPNTFQIIDMSTLPATVSVVYSGTDLFERGHTIYIDGDKMYIGIATYTAGGGYSSMNVYSLATPTAPVLLRSLTQDVPLNVINGVHDMFVRNDTVYASCGYAGLYIFKLTAANTFTQIGSYTGYNAGSAYNHSSWLTQDGKYLVFCDEVPAGLPIRFTDVQNLSNIQTLQAFKPFSGTTPHNPYVIGNKWAVVSCYQDGLYIYDISTPGSAVQTGFFDTYPQGGANVSSYGGQDYRGNWGAYPYLPSGIIIAGDMQNGIFILDPTTAFSPVGIKDHSAPAPNFIFYPNPASDKIAVNYNTMNPTSIQIKNMLGQIVFEKNYSSMIHDYVNVSDFANGTYIISVAENNKTLTKKLIVNH